MIHQNKLKIKKKELIGSYLNRNKIKFYLKKNNKTINIFEIEKIENSNNFNFI